MGCEGKSNCGSMTTERDHDHPSVSTEVRKYEFTKVDAAVQQLDPWSSCNTPGIPLNCGPRPMATQEGLAAQGLAGSTGRDFDACRMHALIWQLLIVHGPLLYRKE